MPLRDALAEAGREWRRARAIQSVLPAALAGLVILSGAAWWAATGWGPPGLAVLIGWGSALAGIVVGAVRAHRRWRELGAVAVADRIEGLGATRRGAVGSLLSPCVPGTSPVLHEAAIAERTAWVATHAQQVLAPAAAQVRQRTRGLLAATGVTVAALVLARPLGGAPAMVWKPWDAWQALSAPVRLAVDHDLVGRGERVTFTATALGQRHAVLLLRSPGESWREEPLELDPAGRATVMSVPIRAELVAKLRAGGRESRELRVTVRLPAFLGALALVADYPEYLSLDDEVLPADGEMLVLPEGTRLSLTGRATTPLDSAWLHSEVGVIPLAAEGLAFSGGFVPQQSATWRLEVRPTQGGVLDGIPPPLAIRVVPDSAPVVTVPVPGGDTVASPARQLPVVVAVEDDHGIRSIWLEVRRGQGGEARRIALPASDSAIDRALISHMLELGSAGLRPGDTVFYAAAASDNSPRRQVGRSREYLLHIPTAAEQRAAQAAATANVAGGLDSLAAAARQAQRQSEDLARERDRGAENGQQGGGEPMTSEAARRAERAAERQEQIEEQVADLTRELGALERAAGDRGLADSVLSAQVAEVRQLLDRALTPQLRRAMDELRESLRQLDPERSRTALRDLAQQQARMQEAIERARELFQRAALETDLGQLAATAAALLEDQQRAAGQLDRDSTAGARAEAALAERTDSLASGLENTAATLPSPRGAADLRQAGQRAREAAEAMRQAAAAARRGDRPQARQQAQAAGEALRPLEEQIREEREELREEMKAEVTAALDRLLAETARLLAGQHAVAEAFRRGALAGPLRAEESMLEESTGKLLEQVIAVSGKSALISPRIGTALAAARDGMRTAIEATSSASASPGTASDRAGEAVDMLALAAYSLLRSRQNVENAESGTGLEEAMQQMQQAAGAQGELSEQGQSMMSREGQPGLSEMMQLALQQRAVARQLEQIRARGQLPGAGELGAEARDLARSLEQGSLSPETLERQRRLFRRMLDAGRSLEGDERDEEKERRSESANSGGQSRPGALDQRLLRGAEFPLPSWEALQRLAPDDRRRVLDYFRRLTENPGR